MYYCIELPVLGLQFVDFLVSHQVLLAVTVLLTSSASETHSVAWYFPFGRTNSVDAQ